MPDLRTLIAEAMTEARGKYDLVLDGPPHGDFSKFNLQDDDGKNVFAGDRWACEAHLERLVAVAVLRKLQEAGLAICDQSNLELCEADYIPVTLAMIAAGDAP